MATKPNAPIVTAYLAEQGAEWSADAIAAALAAEEANQARRCRVPVPTVDEPDPEWPADLAEALCRRVAANLAVRAVPLGVQSSINDFGVSSTRVGGLDREVRRLEAPYRKLVKG